ncbi:MAG: sigma-54-dependent Fis family transcriptional regulator [Phycisphaerales bacterium]|nr:MAG: sigma-54-dependent Fis family transcriptional regulator [Phycisphaerales bacterium]
MACKAKLLIVDDEPLKRVVMLERLKEEGYVVDAYDSPLAAEKVLARNSYDVILTDIRMPGLDGISFLKKIKDRDRNQAVIVMTAFATVETAIEAMKQGAYDYLQKPFSTEELILKLGRLLRYKGIEEENRLLRRELRSGSGETKLIGKSKAIRDVLSKVNMLASVDSNVLIQGASGTGKECVARLIHESSFRSSGPFIAISCGSLPSELIEAELFGYEQGAFTGAVKQRAGRFELADGGTLFLDDVDDIPVGLQVKLLRVIQERKFERIGSEMTLSVNFRLIAASKDNLESLVNKGRFREDLYYRLNVVPVHLLPLRQRREDIPLLCEYFVNRFAVKLNLRGPRIDEEAMSKLVNYGWPGNVRELENIIERMLVLSRDGHIKVETLPAEFSAPDTSAITVRTDYLDQVDLHRTMADIEDQLVRWALTKSDGNLARAASLLNIPRSSLQYKVSKLSGLDE